MPCPRASRPARPVGRPGFRVVLAAVAGPWVLSQASWVPRPLRSYAEGEPGRGAEPGVRRYSHAEAHALEDGGDVELSWEVDADPDSILALDLEHPEGVKVLECERRRLLLEVPSGHLKLAQKWRHVTASDSRHGCRHLRDHSLYHRILSVDKAEPVQGDRGRARMELATEELASVSQIFSHMSLRYTYTPGEAKAKEPREAGSSAPARSMSESYTKAKPLYQSSFTPDATAKHNSMFNLNIPQQVSNIGWNWDYDANTTRNPQFKYIFPGGVGYMRLYKPYLKAHFGLNLTFASHINGFMKSPKVNITGELKGWADFNADIATAANFKTDRSASMLDNILDKIPLSGLENLTREEALMQPIKFYFGGTPLTVKPGFSCQLKAYHLGLLKGSLRVSVATHLVITARMHFNTDSGLLQTNVHADAQDVKFTPPTWMLFTNHFEMGMMLQPTLWLTGSFGQMQDMEMGFALRPFFNISIMQKDAMLGISSGAKELAIYPWRAVGLPSGKNYVIKVGVHGKYKMTSNQMSTGVAEYVDNVEDFTFGMVDQAQLVGAPIEVSILEDGKDVVATGLATCSSIVNGQCSPRPVTAKMLVGGKDVEVHLSVIWQESALSVLESKIRSVSLRFPAITISDRAVAKKLANPDALANALLRLKRNGRTFSVPLTSKMNTRTLLHSRVIIEFGPCFLDSWKSETAYQPLLDPTGSGAGEEATAATLELVLNGEVVASGVMPPVQWDEVGVSRDFDPMSSSLEMSSVAPIPAMVPMYSDGRMVGTGELEIDVMPPSTSAFWIFPHEAQDFEDGEEYSFAWTTRGALEGTKYNFTLTAQLVGEDGSLQPTAWQQPVSAACTRNSGIHIYRYHGDQDPCSFQVKIATPSQLVGKRVVILALWLDANSMPHEMVSEPVRFVAAGAGTSRRLDSTSTGQWGIVSKGSVDHTGFNSKVKDKLGKLESHCNAQDLDYALGAGMNFVQHMKNVMTPMGMGMGMAGDDPSASMGGMSPDWTSEPVSLWNLGDGGSSRGEMAKVLPNSLCAQGACKGVLPGCKRKKVNTFLIPGIHVRLSRSFSWKPHSGPKMRHIIAYALALLPSAIKISEKQVASQVEKAGSNNPILDTIFGITTTTTAPAPAPTTTAPPAPTHPPRTTPPTTEAPAPAPAPTTASAPAPTTTAPVASHETPSTSPSPSRPTEPPTEPLPTTKAPAPPPPPPPPPRAGRRLTAEEERALEEIEGPDSLDGEDVEFDRFAVTIIQPMEYELTEDLLRQVWMRGGFLGLEDGREKTHGPVEITGLYLRDPPKAERTTLPAFPRGASGQPRTAIEAFELPALQPAARALPGAPSPHGAAAASRAGGALPAALAGLAALVTAALAVRAAARQRSPPVAPYVAVGPADAPLPPRERSQDFGA